jgi:hypothetical protein
MSEDVGAADPPLSSQVEVRVQLPSITLYRNDGFEG